MKAVITVTGKDSMGIIAGVAGKCAELGANIVDISQSVLQEYFAMIMLADIDHLQVDFSEFVDELEALGEQKGLCVQAMHEEIFNTMHHI
ncbi:MAG: ACT domain-containing protein [Clostridia bacterium]|nr:ACT domain-containing protein [Clostridia bacterium]